MFGNTENVGDRHLPTGSAADAAGNPSISYPLLHHHQQQQFHHAIMMPLAPPPTMPVPPFLGGGDDDEFLRRDERLPHWSEQETRDLIETRAQVEWGFASPKRTKNLWELVADRMREKGYWRTADQCKWKWKYLVSRYKGQEASDVDGVPPFFNEIHAVFTARANRVQQSQGVADTGVAIGRKRFNDASEDQSNEEFMAEQEDEEEIEAEHQAGKGSAVKRREKRQKMREKEGSKLTNVSKNGRFHNGLQEMMRNFMEQQKTIDMEWRASMEKHAQERERFEEEWQQKMERVERERLMMEQTWKQREEERRLREESRAEKRDALLTALLNKLIHEESS